MREIPGSPPWEDRVVMAEEIQEDDSRGQSFVEKQVVKLAELAENTNGFIRFITKRVNINEREFFEILDELVESQPEELVEAQKVLSRREGIINNAHDEARHVLEAAKKRLEELTSDEEVVRHANREASRIIRDAEKRGEQIRLEAIEYVYHKMEELEKHFAGTLNTVKNGKLLLEREFAQISAEAEDAG